MNNITLEKEPSMDTKETILRNATELFLNKGYDRTSLNEIAKSSGITKGGIYHYYSSKEKLHDAVIDYIFSRLFDPLIEDIKNEASFKKVIDLVLNMDEGYYEEPQTFREKYKYLKLFVDYLEKTPESIDIIKQKNEEFAKIIVSKFLECQKIGELKPDLNPYKITAKLFAFSIGVKHCFGQLHFEKYKSELKKELSQELWDSIKNE
ncbi:TetR/AcrR family transcriptional regulator [Methanococcus voltae]|uniref:Transcriptional regulator, TetR family n=1 Tax=Methanococcus voltae (strain ATCC BAA-1334 / A3) TaxID=456320 RepID=D7DS90_METV3|nr:TetR/AcrR family transcriptional regulator [Methanococcus voltae]MCS3901526.1 AcrR family transcriptional regulator [Methanococcus voltae]